MLSITGNQWSRVSLLLLLLSAVGVLWCNFLIQPWSWHLAPPRRSASSSWELELFRAANDQSFFTITEKALIVAINYLLGLFGDLGFSPRRISNIISIPCLSRFYTGYHIFVYCMSELRRPPPRTPARWTGLVCSTRSRCSSSTRSCPPGTSAASRNPSPVGSGQNTGKL